MDKCKCRSIPTFRSAKLALTNLKKLLLPKKVSSSLLDLAKTFSLDRKIGCYFNGTIIGTNNFVETISSECAALQCVDGVGAPKIQMMSKGCECGGEFDQFNLNYLFLTSIIQFKLERNDNSQSKAEYLYCFFIYINDQPNILDTYSLVMPQSSIVISDGTTL